ncbi:hypothetical protein [Mesorhizobium sp. AR02]|nr:hypothetical protein [Mesorhizobium sp. AR02]
MENEPLIAEPPEAAFLAWLPGRCRTIRWRAQGQRGADGTAL